MPSRLLDVGFMNTLSPVAVEPLMIGDLLVDPPILQAPMAGFTNYAFRQMVRDYGGTGLQATEMILSLIHI